MTRRLLLSVYVVALGLILGCGGNDETRDIIAHVEPGAVVDSADMENVVLVWVGDSPIAVSDLRNHMLLTSGPNTLEAYIKNPDVVDLALAALVDQYAWGEKAEKEGYELTPAELRVLEARKMEFLATRYVAEVTQEENRPSREEVEAYYHEHQEDYIMPPRVAVRHILVRTKEEAEDIKRQIDDGADFVEMVKEYSIDPRTKDVDGALGYVKRGTKLLGLGRRSQTFENTVLPMHVGEVAVVSTDLGWHVVKVEKKEGGEPRPLEEVYQAISDYLMNDKFRNNYAEQAETVRREIGVRYVDDNMEAFTGVATSPQHLMDMAAGTSDPSGRIALYRRVAFNYPNDPIAAEAQFRIAYTLYADMKDPLLAVKALKRLQEIWPDSEWRQAGDYLQDHLTEQPGAVGSADDIIEKIRSESSAN